MTKKTRVVKPRPIDLESAVNRIGGTIVLRQWFKNCGIPLSYQQSFSWVQKGYIPHKWGSTLQSVAENHAHYNADVMYLLDFVAEKPDPAKRGARFKLAQEYPNPDLKRLIENFGGPARFIRRLSQEQHFSRGAEVSRSAVYHWLSIGYISRDDVRDWLKRKAGATDKMLGSPRGAFETDPRFKDHHIGGGFTKHEPHECPPFTVQQEQMIGDLDKPEPTTEEEANDLVPDLDPDDMLS